jgi:DNA-binding MarR family transcriptional regulator
VFADSTAVAEDELRAFEVATRDLVGLALRSLSALGGRVSLPQFRLLLVLHERGRLPSSQVADALGLVGSSVTRLADRLVAAGYVVRGSDPGNRSIVTLDLTRRGRALVRKVIAHRRTELSRLLAKMGPETRAACARGLTELHELIGAEFTVGRPNSMPLGRLARRLP